MKIYELTFKISKKNNNNKNTDKNYIIELSLPQIYDS